MNQYGGVPFVWRPANGIDANGTYMRFPALSNGISITATGPVRIYFTLGDFNSDQNGIDVTNTPSGYQYSAPVQIRGIWVKALNIAADIELTSFSHAGL
jgi:hypothetical protein